MSSSILGNSMLKQQMFKVRLRSELMGQSAFLDFCAGNRHQIVMGARVAKVAQLIGLSCKCGTNYT